MQLDFKPERQRLVLGQQLVLVWFLEETFEKQ